MADLPATANVSTTAGGSGAAQSGGAGKPASSATPPTPPHESWRDTFEQIVFAFVLALVFRTFEAEAFVIPTGSMAPTLFGRHKEVSCEQCGHVISVGASSEVDRDNGRLNGSRAEGAICPNCRFPNTNVKEGRVFNGDRILVNKFPYQLSDPERFDVFVFKYPHEPTVNYIKRLVGLPNETIRIRGGDLYLVGDDGQQSILRKPDQTVQQAIQILVHDNDYPAPKLIDLGHSQRWAGVIPDDHPDSKTGWSDDPRGWTEDVAERSFSLAGAVSQGDTKWLRYRHLVPSVDDWERIEAGERPELRPSLISDFTGYNAVWGSRSLRNDGYGYDHSAAASVTPGSFWVGDLTVSGTIDIESLSPGAELVFELCEGPFTYQCKIDPSSGEAQLFSFANFLKPGEKTLLSSAPTSITGTGSYDLSFANVDDRLSLWVNGSLIEFPEGGVYQRHLNDPSHLAQRTDLSPIGIGGRNCALSARHLVVKRDIYYRADHPQFTVEDGEYKTLSSTLSRLLDSPEAWNNHYSPDADTVDIRVAPESYLALGDNSAHSADSRAWPIGQQSVHSKYLVGKAFWIYWPHGVPFLNDGKGYPISYHAQNPRSDDEPYAQYVIPFYPNIPRMKRIR
ncbi:MAG: signal peptidase I [Planctomycetaceae bacterium]